MKNHYIQAVLGLLREGKDVSDVFSGLTRALNAKGHTRLHASILRGVAKELESSRGQDGAVITVNSEEEIASVMRDIEAALATLEAPQKHEVVVDDTIIGGIIATYNNKIIDQSYKTKLVSLYRNIYN